MNLILDEEVVKELVADSFSVENIKIELAKLLNDDTCRKDMKRGYQEVYNRLGEPGAPSHAAKIMVELLNK